MMIFALIWHIESSQKRHFWVSEKSCFLCFLCWNYDFRVFWVFRSKGVKKQVKNDHFWEKSDLFWRHTRGGLVLPKIVIFRDFRDFRDFRVLSILRCFGGPKTMKNRWKSPFFTFLNISGLNFIDFLAFFDKKDTFLIFRKFVFFVFFWFYWLFRVDFYRKVAKRIKKGSKLVKKGSKTTLFSTSFFHEKTAFFTFGRGSGES